MNSVNLTGRLAGEPKVREIADGRMVTSFTVAVASGHKDGEASFIRCVAFRSTAGYIANYGKKGQKIALSGTLKTGSYTNKDGQKIYTTEVYVASAELEYRTDVPETSTEEQK